MSGSRLLSSFALLNLCVLVLLLFTLLHPIAAANSLGDATCQRDQDRPGDEESNVTWTREWDPSFDERIYTDRCTIDRIPAEEISTEAFRAMYENKEPVILVGTNDQSDIQNRTRRPHLLQNVLDANRMVVLSTANTHSYKKQYGVTLGTLASESNGRGLWISPPSTQKQYNTMFCIHATAEYILNYVQTQQPGTSGAQTYYSFGDHDPAEWNDFLALYHPPRKFMRDEDPYAYSFGLAGSGTGVPFHTHGPGFAEVLHGRKRWWLYPPSPQDPPFHDPDRSTLDYALEYYPLLRDRVDRKEDHRHLHADSVAFSDELLDVHTFAEDELPPYECVLGPNEALYFPPQWWHATLNIGEGVFISTFT